MDRIDIHGATPAASPRGKYFARATGTHFAALAQDAGSTVVELYDEIGYWGVTAKDFRDQLNGLTGPLTLRINSPGGDVFDGIAMFNDLLAYKSKGAVNVEISGIAASIASVIAMAGDTVSIASNAFFMIHDAWTIALGNRHDMLAISEVLGQIDEAIARTYVGRAKVGIRSVRDMMDAETWLASADAIDKGFADKLLTAPAAAEEGAVTAKFDLTNVFAKIPDALRWDGAQPGEAITARDIEKELMRDAGPRSRSQARALMRACKQGPEDATRDAGGEGLKSLLRTLEATNAQLNPPA